MNSYNIISTGHWSLNNINDNFNVQPPKEQPWKFGVFKVYNKKAFCLTVAGGAIGGMLVLGLVYGLTHGQGLKGSVHFPTPLPVMVLGLASTIGAGSGAYLICKCYWPKPVFQSAKSAKSGNKNTTAFLPSNAQVPKKLISKPKHSTSQPKQLMIQSLTQYPIDHNDPKSSNLNNKLNTGKSVITTPKSSILNNTDIDTIDQNQLIELPGQSKVVYKTIDPQELNALKGLFDRFNYNVTGALVMHSLQIYHLSVIQKYGWRSDQNDNDYEQKFHALWDSCRYYADAIQRSDYINAKEHKLQLNQNLEAFLKIQSSPYDQVQNNAVVQALHASFLDRYFCGFLNVPPTTFPVFDNGSIFTNYKYYGQVHTLLPALILLSRVYLQFNQESKLRTLILNAKEQYKDQDSPKNHLENICEDLLKCGFDIQNDESWQSFLKLMHLIHAAQDESGSQESPALKALTDELITYHQTLHSNANAALQTPSLHSWIEAISASVKNFPQNLLSNQ